MLKTVHFITGQHLKKSSLSESSSDMMDLEDAVDTTPNLLPDSQVRLVPFFGTTVTTVEKSLQPNNCYKQTSSNGQSTQQRHNSALAVSIETDVWLLGKFHQKFYYYFFYVFVQFYTRYQCWAFTQGFTWNNTIAIKYKKNNNNKLAFNNNWLYLHALSFLLFSPPQKKNHHHFYYHHHNHHFQNNNANANRSPNCNFTEIYQSFF